MSGSNLPLRALAVFEAAARLGSFREAAEELGLTPSAVSHQVRHLEAGLGLRLFERVGRGVLLSQEGLRFHAHVRDGFDKLRYAIKSLKGRETYGRAVEVVRVSTPPSFASKWLLPRLSGFLARHPSIDIRVNAQAGLGVDLSNVDLAIAYGGPGKWEAQALAWLEETVQPICAPALIAAGAIRSPGDLLRLTLIRTRGNTVSWDTPEPSSSTPRIWRSRRPPGGSGSCSKATS
jgi:LysR family glycine cleavage system transcriptional activator